MLVNEGESNRKLAKMFAGKNFKKLDTKTSSCADLIKKRACRGLLKIGVCAAAKHKIKLMLLHSSNKLNRGVFRTLSKIYDGTFFLKE